MKSTENCIWICRRRHKMADEEEIPTCVVLPTEQTLSGLLIDLKAQNFELGQSTVDTAKSFFISLADKFRNAKYRSWELTPSYDNLELEGKAYTESFNCHVPLIIMCFKAYSVLFQTQAIIYGVHPSKRASDNADDFMEFQNARKAVWDVRSELNRLLERWLELNCDHFDAVQKIQKLKEIQTQLATTFNQRLTRRL